jgi:RNA polymerase sigma-70 factor (ECF subfamily)
MANPLGPAQTTSRERELLERLRAGDEEAFTRLVDDHYGTMLMVAQTHVRTRAVAEEVVQEAWVGVLKGLDRFEGRSSLKTWILRIVANIARTRGARESRIVPFASLATAGEEPAVDPERFRGPTDAFPGHWWAYPSDWAALPEATLHAQETRDVVRRAIDELPPAQRAVITLRDMVGCEPDEVCDALELTDGNQRVLLHRARSRVRAALERHLDG